MSSYTVAFVANLLSTTTEITTLVSILHERFESDRNVQYMRRVTTGNSRPFFAQMFSHFNKPFRNLYNFLLPSFSSASTVKVLLDGKA